MRILVVDPGHGPRAQIAETLLGAMLPAEFRVESAGTEPGEDLAGVDRVMDELGLRFSPRRTSLADVALPPPDLLVAVCEEGCPACPYVPGSARVERWPTPPIVERGHFRLEQLRSARDRLRSSAAAFAATELARPRR